MILVGERKAETSMKMKMAHPVRWRVRNTAGIGVCSRDIGGEENSINDKGEWYFGIKEGETYEAV